jgi:hypothetical protein
MNAMLQVLLEQQEKERLKQKSNGKSRYHYWNTRKRISRKWEVIPQPKKEIIELLRQRQDLICFRISLAPAIRSLIKVFEL